MEILSPATTFYLLTCLPTAICLVVIFKTLSVNNKNRRLMAELSETTKINIEKLAELTELREKYSSVLDFQNSLQIAELSTKLQTPRINAQTKNEGSFTPEKYKYAQTLAEKGMSAEEIGAVLTMSAHEANQLINLSKIGQCH